DCRPAPAVLDYAAGARGARQTAAEPVPPRPLVVRDEVTAGARAAATRVSANAVAVARRCRVRAHGIRAWGSHRLKVRLMHEVNAALRRLDELPIDGHESRLSSGALVSS